MLKGKTTLMTRMVALLVLCAPLTAAVQATHPSGALYEWSGEFVSADTKAATLTVKSRVAYPQALSELKQFTPGEQVWVVWSGSRDYSDAMRQVRRAQAGTAIAEDLVLPAEFVSTEAPSPYVTIRVKVREGSLSAIKDVKPGEWVTVTSRHRPSTQAEAVVSVRPYSTSTT